MTAGIQEFCAGLRVLGYQPTTYEQMPGYVTFPFWIPCGRFIGQNIKLGLVVPQDFALTTPSGPHSTPILATDDGSGQAPRGGLHLNHDPNFKTLTGEDWQYWSRPYPGWNSPEHPVAAYMAFIKKLWADI
jgi:hypothetical protein